jgi:hypothetical protein
MTPDIRQDPQYDEPVNIEMDPEEALKTLLGSGEDESEEETTEDE